MERAFILDGRADTLEDQAKGPMASAAETNMPHNQVVAVVKSIPGYQAAFRAAYPGAPITIDVVSKALASYQRTVVSGVSPFDLWLNGDDSALTASAKRGFVVFNTKGNCASCHSSATRAWRRSAR